MKNKYLLIMFLILALTLTLFACVEECEHVDLDDNNLCDKCEAHFSDGDEPLPEATKYSVVLTVLLDNGEPLSGVEVYLTRGEVTTSFVTNSEGKAEGKLEAGLYSVGYNYETLPEYCTTDLYGVKVEESENAFTVTVTDNSPDGSAEKPFFVSENETEITLAAGQEIYYLIRVSSIRHINVYNSAAVIGYKGESYEATDGVASLVINPDGTDVTSTVFSVKNNSSETITATLEVNAPLGSYENPIDLEENGATVTVNCDTFVYYCWTATADGMLTLTSDSERNNIFIRRVLENDVPVDRYTGGELSVSMEVAAGDIITIGVSATEAANEAYDVEISFSLAIE